MQESARGVLMTPDGRVLLLKTRGRNAVLWITPGGRIRPGEEARAAARREVTEETGCQDPDIREEIWIRRAMSHDGQRWVPELERFFLVPTEAFEPSPAGLEPEERARHLGYRWWTIEEIAGSSESFAPQRLAELLRDLLERGPPQTPRDSGA